MSDQASSPETKAPRWQPLSARERRIVAVLVEKAKTTPSAYPMSLNAVVTGCNQKSNRDPIMQVEPEDVEESLDRLRELGAVGMVEGFGRVTKYRHYLNEWLGVEKAEMAVMVELLLRGPQTEGELRGRASRMEAIPDLPSLRGILQALKSKGLVVSLTPEGRGHVVTHALYPPKEMEHVQARFTGARPVATESEEAPPAVAPVASGVEAELVASLREELADLRSALVELRDEVATLTTALERTDDDLRRLRSDLGA